MASLGQGGQYGSFDGDTAPYGYSPPQLAQDQGIFADKLPFVRGPRRRLNIVAVWASLFTPWILFTAIFGLMSFQVHYEEPELVYFLVGCCLVGILILGGFAYSQRQHYSPERELSWLFVLFQMMMLAWLMGIILGSLNYIFSTAPYEQMTHLNSYTNVNPALMKGQQLMDAGSVVFTENTFLDVKRSMGFKNQDVYCVAPISAGNITAPTYDFWAVGINCCSKMANDFHCSGARKLKTHSALRVLHSAARPYYRLAVQQAEAAYKIRANHPLFFEWTEDPAATIHTWKISTRNNFLAGMFSYLIFQAFLVAVTTLSFARLGR